MSAYRRSDQSRYFTGAEPADRFTAQIHSTVQAAMDAIETS